MKKILISGLLCMALSISNATTIVFSGCYTTQNDFLHFEPGSGWNEVERVSINEVALKKSLKEHKKDFEEITLEIPGKFYLYGGWVQTFIGAYAFSGLRSEFARIRLKCTLGKDIGCSPVLIDNDFEQMFFGSSSIIEIDLRGAKPTSEIKDASEMCRGCTRLKKIKFGNCTIPASAKMNNMFLGCNALEEQDDFEIITK